MPNRPHAIAWAPQDMEQPKAHLIGDGHRHRYDRPPYAKRERADWLHPVWDRVPPEERICIHCGHSERDIRRHRANKKPERVVRPSRVADALVGAMLAADAINKDNLRGLNNFAIVYGDGPYRIKWYDDQACYGQLLGGGEVSKARYFIDRAGRPDTSEYRNYQRWCMTESPYSMAFVNDPDHYAKTRCTIQDCTKMPGQYLVGAAMQLRYLYEFSVMPKTWEFLVDKGVDPAIAFIAMSWGSVPGKIYMPNRHGASGGHQILDNSFKRGGLQNFLNHNIRSTTMVRRYVRYNEYQNETKTLVPGYQSMEYRGLSGIWQGADETNTLIMPGDADIKVKDSMGRDIKRRGFDFSNLTGDEFNKEFIKLNGVSYEPTESLHRERRSSVRENVSECRVESSEA